MIASTLPVVFAALLCLESRVLAQPIGGSFDCTPSLWTYGTNVTIKLRIDRTKYPSKCDGNPNDRPQFQSSPDGVSVYTTKCAVTNDIQTSCSFPAGTLGCGCTDINDNGYFVIEYNFVASVTDQRWWKIDLDCLNATTLGPGLSFPECRDVPFMTTTVAPPTTTATTTPEPESEDTSAVTESTSGTLSSSNTTTASTTPISHTSSTANVQNTTDKNDNSQKHVTIYVAVGFVVLVVIVLCATGVWLYYRYQRRKSERITKQ